VPYLSKLKHLRVLRLYSTALSAEAHDKIKAALPGVTLDVRGGQLGIRGDTTAARCMVRDVMPNTAASKADIQPGDIIVKCDGKEVETFPALVEMMRIKPAGTKVKLGILRADKTLERELTLEVWRDPSLEERPDPGPLQK
jgi:serine protease Do